MIRSINDITQLLTESGKSELEPELKHEIGCGVRPFSLSKKLTMPFLAIKNCILIFISCIVNDVLWFESRHGGPLTLKCHWGEKLNTEF